MNKNLRKNIVSAIITVAILACAFVISGKMAAQKKSTVVDKATKKERRTVKVASFSAADQANIITIDGRLEAHDRVNVTSKVQGLLQQGSVLREGMYKAKGDLLFALDDREASYTLKAQRSALLTAITQMMPDLKFDYPEGFEQWKAYLDAFDIDAPLASLPVAASPQEKYFVAGRNIYNQYYSIKSLETRLQEYRIYAPFSGVITAVNVFPGALVSPSQVLASMINTSTYEIEAPVPLSALQYVRTGQKVTMRSTDLAQTWTGTVSRIGTQIDAATQNIPLYIALSGKGLRDGMYLQGSLQGRDLEAVTKLPKSIFLSPTAIYVVEDSTLIAHEIESVKRTDDYVLVRGLSPDQRVVVGSLAGLFEGQKVSY